MQMISDMERTLWRDKILEARRSTPECRMRACGDLFDDWVERTRWAVQDEMPNASTDDILREIRRRLEINARVENRHEVE